MRMEIRNLEAAGIDEDTIVAHLGITHKEVRRKLKKPQEKLTVSCRAEIQHTDDYTAKNKDLALQYRTTSDEVFKARYNPLPRKATPTDEQIEMAFHEGYITVKSLAEYLSSPEKPVREWLEARGAATARKPNTHTRRIQHDIVAHIHRGLPYSDIAAQYHVSVSTVQTLAKKAGVTRQTQRKNMDNWPEILAYADEHTVSEAARKYNVERSNIYYHRKKAL